MKALMNTLMTCAVLGMMSANAFAGGGGGGAKDDGTIVIKNDGPANQILLVVVGKLADTKLTTFLAAGGQIVSPGDTASFDVPAGDTTVTALFIDDTSLMVSGKKVEKLFPVGKKQTVNVSATIAGANAVLK